MSANGLLRLCIHAAMLAKEVATSYSHYAHDQWDFHHMAHHQGIALHHSQGAEVDACSICMDKLLGDVDGLPCGHQLHGNCKVELIARGYRQCPLCRAPLDRMKIIEEIRKLQTGSQEAQVHAADALMNLAENSQNQDVIREEGGIQALIMVLRVGSQLGQAFSAATLRNLAENGKNQDVIREEGGIHPLIMILREGSQETQVYAADALKNLAWNKQNQNAIRQEGGIHPLVDVLRNGNWEGQACAAAALGVLAGNSEEKDAIRDEGGIQPLIKVLREGSQEAQVYAAWALGNLAGNHQNQDVIREEGGIQALIDVLGEGSQEAQAAARALHNLAMNSKNQAVIQAAAAELKGQLQENQSGDLDQKSRQASGPRTSGAFLEWNADTQPISVRLFIQTYTAVIGIVAIVLISLFVCSGVAFFKLHYRRGAWGKGEEPLLLVQTTDLANRVLSIC